jgi:hypothetical protein
MAGKFDLVFLSLYLQHGYYVWEVLQHIKKLGPDLPMIILAEFDKYLYEPRLELADGYVVESWSAAKELKQLMDAILCDELMGRKRPYQVSASEGEASKVVQ